MSVQLSLRLPDEMAIQLEGIAEETDRTKAYLIKKAIEHYLEEFADLQIAFDRMNDPEDETISSDEMRQLLDDDN